jgi:hypothetical protein
MAVGSVPKKEIISSNRNGPSRRGLVSPRWSRWARSAGMAEQAAPANVTNATLFLLGQQMGSGAGTHAGSLAALFGDLSDIVNVEGRNTKGQDRESGVPGHEQYPFGHPEKVRTTVGR